MAAMVGAFLPAKRPVGEDVEEDFRGELRMQRMAGAVRNQMPDDGIADEGQVADGIENLWRTNSSSNRKALLSTPVSPSTMAFSSDPPSAKPFCRSISTSLRNVNVRAGAMSSTNEASVIRSVLAWCLSSG